MSQRVALVTGGGSGMGEAISHRLAREGMQVGVLDINADAAEAVSNAINQQGGESIALKADISDRQQVADAVEKMHSEFGPITVLVNNAGIESFGMFDSIDEEKWDRIMQINLKGPYVVTQVVLPDMKEAGWGRIVNLASMAAQAGAQGMADYAASKGGVVGLTRTLALELGPFGITVNAIAPGFILTAMVERAIEQGYFPATPEEITRNYPIARPGKPEEVAAACAYFVSEDAGYTSGQLLGINGATWT